MLRSRTRIFDLSYLLVLGATMVWLRRFEIRQLGLVNPDEADLLAAGKRAALSLIPYEKFTTTTYGPVWPMTLGLLHRIGYPLTMPSAHLVATVLSYVICACIYFMASRSVGRASAALLTAGLALVWATGGIPHDVDFIQMASELLPLSLLSFGLCLAVCHPNSKFFHAVGLIFIGSAPFAKYQFLPICLLAAVYLAFAGRHIWVRSRTAALASFGFFGTSGGFLFTLIVLGGNFGKVFEEGLPAVTDYVGGEAPGFLDRLTNASAFYFRYPIFVAAGLLGLAVLENRSRHLEPRKAAMVLLFPGIALMVGAVSTAITPSPFPHYAYMLLASSVVVLAMAAHPRLVELQSPDLLISTSSQTPGHSTPMRLMLIATGIFFVLGASYSLRKATWLEQRTYETSWGKVFSPDGGRPAANHSAAGDIERLCPPGSTAFVWGWAAEMYSYFDWIPASRFTISTWQLNPTENQDTLKHTLAEELTRDRPRCIADAVGPGFFKFTDFSQSLTNQIPLLYNLVDTNYRKEIVTYRSVIGDVPLVLYVKEDRSHNWRNIEIH